jgi:23S rRNA pseudouridine1911/1915/1917 synthase
MYLAVTRGTRSVPSQFRINFPIGSADGSRIRLKLWHNTADGLEALTHCVHLAGFEDYSLFACLPQTGRTNQIRVHLAAVGHWIVGDKMYHPDEDVFLNFYEEGFTDFVSEKTELPRHWLHNTGIQFLASPHLSVGRAPVIAPLTEDLLQHAPTLELLRSAGLPAEPSLQKDAFAALFKQLLKIDFSNAPVVGPES